ncbi:3-phosphoshikimate 1-carboxyvinyltransferase [Pseudemcibacter aquimaris]|uniref:3-phosphoshikimate 1-carboxyvinyltransferase n=1 Tax=Pseudemcibacter aquimaris TaxID=2857064 RepID=UPI0020132598|nr:3-phosphoshikimate 1-carboxyvinyltransferase [Pseudemcibacter aquimaris]MCC3862474.1 3-phosphoshikimate 1-carboxyvinyltransferase [Pseudemcibacter aquimaris]WDU59098.1 3-phosphoshikimate 1-carboxyvinyltransferase [Pseudemcibacter aquimaris]
MNQLSSSKSGPLNGNITVPGDKSISHRSLIMGSLAIGESVISGLLEGEDVLGTAAAMKALGADIYKDDDGYWHVHGVGIGGLKQPDAPLDMGNSGTGVRLLMGLVSTHPITVTFTGDDSLESRPMKRVTDPLTGFGAEFEGSDDGTLPITVKGTSNPMPIKYELPVASAQVKSAVMLAGLNTPGITTVTETIPTRDHSERIFKYFGVPTSLEGDDIHVTGQAEITAKQMAVPADPSSAAFLVVAALITPGSDIVIKNVGMNPARTGLFSTLAEMGGYISFENKREECGENVADLHVKYSELSGITVPESRAPSMIDEYPVLCAAAAAAEGETVMRGIEELRVKESDRISVMVKGLKACGVNVTEHEDGMTVSKSDVTGGAVIKTHLDHRIAMSFLVLGMIAENPITADDGSVIETSFPGFTDLMNGLGANICS